MWSDRKQQQLDELRQQEQESALTDEERRNLEQLLYQLEQDEWQALHPALDRLRDDQTPLHKECSEAETQNAMLAVLAERQADLLARARVQLNVLLIEQTVLNTEYERAMGQPLRDG